MATVLWLVAAALALLGAIVVWQDQLIYFPDRATVAQLDTGGLQAWPSAQDFRGLVAEPESERAARGTAIVFHGNAGHAGHRGFYAQALVPLGWRVVLAEYPGYGPRAGRPSEASLVRDAEATITLAEARHGGPLLLVGESLGAAVAAAAGARQRELVAGLLLITPWDRLAHVGAHHYPWLPVRWLLRDRYDTLAALQGFDRPVVVAVAEQDAIVPPTLGRALHAGLNAPKRLVVIGGADHNDWPAFVDAPWWRDATEAALGRSSVARGAATP
ncbi:MAG TPA: alpha/beta fold hydrolase [Burkholderiaceae bacterium]|nr:alpha/beta fold hydrolase [Burkholderiaceae bacterium]